MSQKIKVIILTILTLMLINCGTVFAENKELTVNNIKQILNYYKPNGYNETLYTEERLQDFVDMANSTTYGYIKYTPNYSLELRYNNSFTVKGSGNNRYIDGNKCNYIFFYETNNSYVKKSGTLGMSYMYYDNAYNYCIGSWTNSTEPNDGISYIDGWSNKPDIVSFYKYPYFEFSAEKIGTTTIENYDENLPCFYPKSFATHVNSYATFKTIGKLYIDENYSISNIYTSTPIINVYNISQTKSWQYENYLIFTDNIIENGYKTYYINIDKTYINTPYIYSMELISQDNKLGNNILINFVLLTETTEGEGIIVESGDTEVSGDFTKDETTLGDIQNTINNIFQKPNEEELKKQQEENINKIREQISGDLYNNEVFSALTTAEQGLIELLEGEPRRL